jgi:hypothetical protein
MNVYCTCLVLGLCLHMKCKRNAEKVENAKKLTFMVMHGWWNSGRIKFHVSARTSVIISCDEAFL